MQIICKLRSRMNQVDGKKSQYAKRNEIRGVS